MVTVLLVNDAVVTSLPNVSLIVAAFPPVRAASTKAIPVVCLFSCHSVCFYSLLVNPPISVGFLHVHQRHNYYMQRTPYNYACHISHNVLPTPMIIRLMVVWQL